MSIDETQRNIDLTDIKAQKGFAWAVLRFTLLTGNHLYQWSAIALEPFHQLQFFRFRQFR